MAHVFSCVHGSVCMRECVCLFWRSVLHALHMSVHCSSACAAHVSPSATCQSSRAPRTHNINVIITRACLLEYIRMHSMVPSPKALWEDIQARV